MAKEYYRGLRLKSPRYNPHTGEWEARGVLACGGKLVVEGATLGDAHHNLRETVDNLAAAKRFEIQVCRQRGYLTIKVFFYSGAEYAASGYCEQDTLERLAHMYLRETPASREIKEILADTTYSGPHLLANRLTQAACRMGVI